MICMLVLKITKQLEKAETWECKTTQWMYYNLVLKVAEYLMKTESTWECRSTQLMLYVCRAMYLLQISFDKQSVEGNSLFYWKISRK